ncbi:hypothetical protein HT585_08840 [Ensifer sp. HO-A22]|uniref:Uncharacterized protein n=1 Tax=Ensifer oleiphilus TaxID=2742698 RepID=A0A7Y6Q4M8_9HYPH|nr:hypothetical protein [Ensifer oleiphilus]NVD38960.1 hypothetical protein [Ensifer oleiphilus]
MSEENGFYNPFDGYWQTNTKPTDEILASYREGTIEVPLKPSADHQYILDGWVHVPPTTEEIRARMPPLTARQFRLGLLSGGYTTAQVTQAIEAMPDGEQKETAKIEWEYATILKRLHPLVAVIGAAVNLTDTQIDSMWVAAANV